MTINKLIITIPAYNEEKTIGDVVKSVPKRIKGVKEIRILVWDDGSSDKTSQEAKKAGANFIFCNKQNLGLAKTFNRACNKALELGADVIINTDADNQYDQKQIPKLIRPILDEKADMVIGDRQVESLKHMPTAKKIGNVFGSFTIRWLSGAKIKDASSGFRAFTKECAQQFNLLSSHTYTHETIIQAVNNDLVITEVPVSFRKRVSGNSRLISGIWPHIKKSAATIVRTILMYKAFKYLVTTGVILMTLGGLVGLRFLYFFLASEGAGHIQSLILASILINLGFTTTVMGVLADLVVINRKTQEKR